MLKVDDDDVIIRTAENGKKYAINTETGTIEGGLGPGSAGTKIEAGGSKNERSELYEGTANAGSQEPSDAGASGGVAKGMESIPGSNQGGNSASGGGDATAGGEGTGNNQQISRFRLASPQEYSEAMGKWAESSDKGNLDTVDMHSASEWQDIGAKSFLNDGFDSNGNPATYGGAIKPDGDIVGVYSGVPGKSKEIMLNAIANNGNKLDAYAVNGETGEPSKLAHIYHKSGFIPIARVPFDAQYAREGFESRNGKLDIVVYKHNGDTADEVNAKYGTYSPPTKEQYDTLPGYGL